MGKLEKKIGVEKDKVIISILKKMNSKFSKKDKKKTKYKKKEKFKRRNKKK